MSTHTLLLIDDRPAMEQDVRSALADEPIQIVVAVNGDRALDRIEADRPDVVLASTTAVGVSGYGVAHYVSQRPYLSQVAVLLLTGNIGPADAHRMKASGARGFIRHPFEPGIVRARVKEVLMFSGPAVGPPELLGQLTQAFDAIDASMTSHGFGGRARPNEIVITPKELARMVDDAVAQASDAYEHARSLAPAPGLPGGGGQRPPAVPPSAWRSRQEQWQREMGLDDLELTPAAAPPAPVVDAELTAQMGVTDFAFDDPAPIATEPVVVVQREIHVPIEPREAPVPSAAQPPALPETGERAADPAAGATSALEPLRQAAVSRWMALAGQAHRFRSALTERAQRRAQQRTEMVPPAPAVLSAANVESVPSPAEPVPAPTPTPTPQSPSAPRLAAMTPEEAARSVFFTFDPIPPVPPPIPREPRED